jgi:hypothetical protein
MVEGSRARDRRTICVLVASLLFGVLTYGWLWLGAIIPPQDQKATCFANLKQIDGAKESWMLEYNKTTNEIPVWPDLVRPRGYMIDIPRCPRGGAYTIGKISEPPTCSIAEHNEHYRNPTGLANASATDTNRSRLP